MKKMLRLLLTLMFLAGCTSTTRITLEQATKPAPQTLTPAQKIAVQGVNKTKYFITKGIITTLDTKLGEVIVDAAFWNSQTKGQRLDLIFCSLIYMANSEGREGGFTGWSATFYDTNGNKVGYMQDRHFNTID